MYKKNGESVDLLLHCEVTRVLWDEIFQMINVVWVMPLRVVDLLGCWRKMQGCHQVAAVWKMIPLCMWCIWMERNARCFKDKERTIAKLKKFFLHTLLFWFSNIVLNGDNVHDFLSLIYRS